MYLLSSVERLGGRAERHHQPGGMPGGARGEAVALQQHDVAPAQVRQMVGDRGADDAAADHDGACAIGQHRCGHAELRSVVFRTGGLDSRSVCQARLAAPYWGCGAAGTIYSTRNASARAAERRRRRADWQARRAEAEHHAMLALRHLDAAKQHVGAQQPGGLPVHLDDPARIECLVQHQHAGLLRRPLPPLPSGAATIRSGRGRPHGCRAGSCAEARCA